MTRILQLFSVLFLLGHSALAQNNAPENIAQLDILPGYATGKGHMIAARIRLQDGWKTYWRAPGDNGIPPRFNWAGSKNLGSVTFHWPQPHVFVQDGIQTIGYKKELILPITVRAQNQNQPVLLRGEVNFGVCDDVCLPVQARFQLDITKDTTGQGGLIKAALRQQPQSARTAGVQGVKCQITPIKDGFHIKASLQKPNSIGSEVVTVFEFSYPNVWIEQSTPSVSNKKMTASANIYSYGDTPLILDRSKITLTLLGSKNAIELHGCPA